MYHFLEQNKGGEGEKKCVSFFVEYRIEKEYRTSYLTWAAVLKQQFEQMDVYEGAEQPGLFVEIWNGLSDEAYAAMKAARTGTITPGLPDETEEGRLWRRIDLDRRRPRESPYMEVHEDHPLGRNLSFARSL